jgi:hypothetical protein
MQLFQKLFAISSESPQTEPKRDEEMKNEPNKDEEIKTEPKRDQAIQNESERIRAIQTEPKRVQEIQNEPKRIQAIPQLRFMGWAQFKANRKVEDTEERCAVDVLAGEPVLFHQHNDTCKQDEVGLQHSEAEADNLPLTAIPDRIRINSNPLFEVLRNVIKGPLEDEKEPLVILRPYKPLLYHEGELRDALATLEGKWAIRSDKAIYSVNSSESSTQINESVQGDEQEKDTAHMMPGMMGTEKDSKTLSMAHESHEAMEELRCLMRFIDALKPPISVIKANVWQVSKTADQASITSGEPRKGGIFFKDLWYIFEPGQCIFRKQGPQRFWRVMQCTGGRHYLSTESLYTDDFGEKSRSFMIDCYHLDFNGQQFGPVYRRFSIQPFQHVIEITALEIFPVNYATHTEKKLVDKLTDCGREFFEATRGVNHRYCSGRALFSTPLGTKMPNTIHSEDAEGSVIVDFDRTFRFNVEWAPEFGHWRDMDFAIEDTRETCEMTLFEEVRHYNGLQHCKVTGCCKNENILSDFYWDRQRRKNFLSVERIFGSDKLGEEFEPCSDDYKLFPDRVFGFILRSHRLGE